MDTVSLLSTAVNVTETAAADQREVAVAANAARAEQAANAVLLEALQQSAAYTADGAATRAVSGTRFSGVA